MTDDVQDDCFRQAAIQERGQHRHLSTLRGLIPRDYIDAGSNQVQYPQMRFG